MVAENTRNSKKATGAQKFFIVPDISFPCEITHEAPKTYKNAPKKSDPAQINSFEVFINGLISVIKQCSLMPSF